MNIKLIGAALGLAIIVAYIAYGIHVWDTRYQTGYKDGVAAEDARITERDNSSRAVDTVRNLEQAQKDLANSYAQQKDLEAKHAQLVTDIGSLRDQLSWLRDSAPAAPVAVPRTRTPAAGPACPAGPDSAGPGRSDQAALAADRATLGQDGLDSFEALKQHEQQQQGWADWLARARASQAAAVPARKVEP